MCLAIPGLLVAVDDGDALLRSGIADFGGVTRAVALAFVPEARVGAHVLVHAGVAIAVLDAAEAARILVALGEPAG